jgi:hypothetical protein
MTAAERHLAENPHWYTNTTEIPAQAGCPHRMRNKDNTECSTCGSLLISGRWKYLVPAWFAYYMDEAPRPEEYHG